MREVNKLTRRLLAEGWKPEDSPPGTRPYKDYEGGWTYTGEAIRGMVWETPCGLLADGGHFLNGYMSYNGVDWKTENGNPVITCPVFPFEPCPLRDPLLRSQRLACHADDIVYQCACHRTDRLYTYAGSIDEAHDRVWKEADALWEVFKTEHKGRVCRYQSHYGRTTKTWRAFYDPLQCARMGCTYCDVLAKQLDQRRGNVFYDLRKSWIQKGEGLFPNQQKVAMEKGCKLLAKTTSLTICEAIVKYGRRSIEDRIRSEYHHQMYFDPTLKIEVVNIRAARVDKRDIMQDLQDIANGIQVTHAADSLKAAKEQKRARRAAAKAQRIRKVERMILTCGWSELDAIWKHRAEKLLDDDRIKELSEQWKSSRTLKPPEDVQLSIFDNTQSEQIIIEESA